MLPLTLRIDRNRRVYYPNLFMRVEQAIHFIVEMVDQPHPLVMVRLDKKTFLPLAFFQLLLRNNELLAEKLVFSKQNFIRRHAAC